MVINTAKYLPQAQHQGLCLKESVQLHQSLSYQPGKLKHYIMRLWYGYNELLETLYNFCLYKILTLTVSYYPQILHLYFVNQEKVYMLEIIHMIVLSVSRCNVWK